MQARVDLERMRRLVEELYVPAVERAFGSDGIHALKRLIDTITRIYRLLDPAARKHPVAIFIRLDKPELLATTGADVAPHHLVADPSYIDNELDDACLVEVLGGGQLRVYAADAYALSDLSNDAIVYFYKDRLEAIIIAGKHYEIQNPVPANGSVFCRPTFSSLDDALQAYRARVIRNTSCFILEKAWNGEKRLFMHPGPEEIMRKSLHQFLRSNFSDAEVRPEQNVDESHPVDIKVTWSETNQRALIEIKWLGKALASDGHITVNYTASRAREGAQQLAEYLESNKTTGPGLRTVGYLVVIDARRRGLTDQSVSIDSENGLYYKDREIEYDPNYHELRSDFAVPIRMFAEPILN